MQSLANLKMNIHFSHVAFYILMFYFKLFRQNIEHFKVSHLLIISHNIKIIINIFVSARILICTSSIVYSVHM